MVTNAARRDVFQAIADPNRRAILRLLAKDRLTLNGVADHFEISRPAISKHIKILSECGLVTMEQQGRERYCAVRLEKLSEVEEFIEASRKIWEARFDRLEAYLAELQANEARESTDANEPKGSTSGSAASKISQQGTPSQVGRARKTKRSYRPSDKQN